MKDKLKINFEKLDGLNLDILNSDKSIDEFVSKPENEQKVLEACANYDYIEYPINLYKEIENNESYWVAEHPDLPGCITYGETKEEALHNLEDGMGKGGERQPGPLCFSGPARTSGQLGPKWQHALLSAG